MPSAEVPRCTVDQYHRMIDAGIFDESGDVELLKGWLVSKMAHDPPHRTGLGVTSETLTSVAPPGWHVNAQVPVTTSDSEPEPDVSVVRGRRRDYPNRHPGPEDVGLLVEVADTTLELDRDFKGPLYAQAGFAAYWIVNIPERRVEVYSGPSSTGPSPHYQRRQDFNENESIPLILDGREVARIPVHELLP